MAIPKKTKKVDVKTGPEFDKTNYMILGAGLLIIVLGFIFLASGDITISPILLVLGYCVVIPLGILVRRHKDQSDQLGIDKDSSVSE